MKCENCGGELVEVFRDEWRIVLNCRDCGTDTIQEVGDEDLDGI